MKKYNITEFARRCNVTPRTLKYYEEIGLFQPASVSSSGYREYTASQIDEVSAIVLFAEHGMRLKEIKTMFEQESLSDVSKRMRRQKQLIGDKISALQEQQKHLEIMLWHMEQAENRLDEPFFIEHFERSIRKEELSDTQIRETFINYLSVGFLNGTILEKAEDGFQLKQLYFQDIERGILCRGSAVFLYTKKPPVKNGEQLEKLRKFAEQKKLNGSEIFCEQIVEGNKTMESLFLYFCFGNIKNLSQE